METDNAEGGREGITLPSVALPAWLYDVPDLYSQLMATAALMESHAGKHLTEADIREATLHQAPGVPIYVAIVTEAAVRCWWNFWTLSVGHRIAGEVCAHHEEAEGKRLAIVETVVDLLNVHRLNPLTAGQGDLMQLAIYATWATGGLGLDGHAFPGINQDDVTAAFCEWVENANQSPDSFIHGDVEGAADMLFNEFRKMDALYNRQLARVLIYNELPAPMLVRYPRFVEAFVAPAQAKEGKVSG